MNEKSLCYDGRIWSICTQTDDDKVYVVTSYGKEGGKIQTARRLVQGKNKGKKNETSAAEQAILEANSKFILKKKSIARKPVLPMLAHTFSGGNGLVFPCFVQPKLDGIRGIYDPILREFRSRQGNVFSSLNLKHIIASLENCTVLLDGELYSRQIPFEILKGAVSAKKVHEMSACVEFHIFDCIVSDKTFEERADVLSKIKTGKGVIFVETLECKSLSEIDVFLEQFNQNYEGIILRNKKGLYSPGRRSFDLQKYKRFLDAEFRIIGFKRENNSDAIVWQCITERGGHFFVKPAGALQTRNPLDEEAKGFINKYLTVKYQEMTSAGVPRFPVGITVRDYE